MIPQRGLTGGVRLMRRVRIAMGETPAQMFLFGKRVLPWILSERV